MTNTALASQRVLIDELYCIGSAGPEGKTRYPEELIQGRRKYNSKSTCLVYLLRISNKV